MKTSWSTDAQGRIGTGTCGNYCGRGRPRSTLTGLQRARLDLLNST